MRFSHIATCVLVLALPIEVATAEQSDATAGCLEEDITYARVHHLTRLCTAALEDPAQAEHFYDLYVRLGKLFEFKAENLSYTPEQTIDVDRARTHWSAAANNFAFAYNTAAASDLERRLEVLWRMERGFKNANRNAELAETLRLKFTIDPDAVLSPEDGHFERMRLADLQGLYASALLLSGQYQSAIDVIDDILGNEMFQRESPKLWLRQLRAEALMGLGDLEGAIAGFDASIADTEPMHRTHIGPDGETIRTPNKHLWEWHVEVRARAKLSRGLLRHAVNDHEGAESDYASALQLVFRYGRGSTIGDAPEAESGTVGSYVVTRLQQLTVFFDLHGLYDPPPPGDPIANRRALIDAFEACMALPECQP